jgi:hypothetical protein
MLNNTKQLEFCSKVLINEFSKNKARKEINFIRYRKHPILIKLTNYKYALIEF